MKFLAFLELIASTFWDVLRRIVGLVLPFFSQAREYRGIGKGLRITLHVVLLIGVLVGLYFLQLKLGLANVLQGVKYLHDFFLSIIAFLIYILAWLAWWLWKLLGPEEETAEFPDIEQAWDEAMRTLYQARIDITDTPLFLVIGSPRGGEDVLFRTAQLSLTVKGAPTRPDAPVRVYANRDGVYVFTGGACLLGKQSDILAGEAVAEEAVGTPTAVEGEDPNLYVTMRADQGLGVPQKVAQMLQRIRDQGREPTQDERDEMRQLMNLGNVAAAKAVRPRSDLMKNADEAALHSARLRFLCKLIVRDRQPYCPVNGILMLVPFAGLDTDEDASRTGSVVHQDLLTTRRALQVNCPVFMMVCDLEQAAGAGEFVGRLADSRNRRLGQRFPLAPDLPSEDTQLKLVDRGVKYICGSLLPTWVFKLFRVENSDREDLMWQTVQGNTSLYRFLGEMRERRPRLAHLVKRSLETREDVPYLFGGCYVAGTGRDEAREAAFVAGVFRRLVEEQDHITWTEEAVVQEGRYERWKKLGYGLMGATAAALAAVAFALLKR